MNCFLALCTMIFLHIFADYSLQGILASMKQKDWWYQQDGMSRKYRNDYKAALIAHAFEWSFVVMLPILRYLLDDWYGGQIFFYMLLLFVNTYSHAYIDNLKANHKSINLIADQALHLGQIFVTWVMWLVIGGF